jgi:hypothetical protein
MMERGNDAPQGFGRAASSSGRAGAFNGATERGCAGGRCASITHKPSDFALPPDPNPLRLVSDTVTLRPRLMQP